MSRHRRGLRARGFTLLEVMLAFVLLAGAMGLLIGMLSGGLRQVRKAQAETEASLYAQSLLDQLGVLEPLRPGHAAGTFDDRYHYQLDIAAVDDPVPRPVTQTTPTGVAEPLPPQFGDRKPVLYQLRLRVEWGNGLPGQQLQLTTLRYRTAPAEDAP